MVKGNLKDYRGDIAASTGQGSPVLCSTSQEELNRSTCKE